MNNQEKTREQLIAELQETQKQIAELNALFEILPDVIMKTDAQGNIEFLSRVLSGGWEREKLIGVNIVDMVPPEGREYVAQMQAKRQAGEKTYEESQSMSPDGQPLWTATRGYPIIRDQQVVGSISIVSDITAQKRAEAEHAHTQQEIIEAQQRAIAELSTPVIPIMDRIIVLPLVGSIDSLRARDVTRSLLAGITQHRAKIVILDVTGVSLMDTGIVNHLNKTIQAARLKGAQTIVTGISDAVAESIVDLGIDWSGVTTLADLQGGLMMALNNLGITFVKGIH